MFGTRREHTLFFHYPVVRFAEETVLFPLKCRGILVQNQLTINVRVYFWNLSSVPLMEVSSLMPVQLCLVHTAADGEV